MGFKVNNGVATQGFNIDDVVTFPAGSWVNIQNFQALRVVDVSVDTTFTLKDNKGNVTITSVLPAGVSSFGNKYVEIKFTAANTLHAMLMYV